MKQYTGTKTLQAKPMTRGEYNEYRGWDIPENEDPYENGYLVEYADGGKPNDDRHKGYISWSPKDVFDGTYVVDEYNTGKTLHNSNASGASKNVKDIIFWGNGDSFKLISKASSKKEGWMKSTKAMQIDGLGCVVQVTTQQGDNVAEAVTFVPSCRIVVIYDSEGNPTARYLEKR